MLLNRKYLVSIYRDVIDGKNIREIHKNIRKITTSTPYFDVRQEKYALKLAEKVKKSVKNEHNFDVIAESILLLYTRNDVYQEMSSIAFDNARKQEEKDKKNIIRGMLAENRQEISLVDVNNVPENNDLGLSWQEYAQYLKGRVFYLASAHDDSAEDHRDYQGRVYVDEKWESIVQSKKLQKMIRDFISRNNIKTLQWVTGRPVWFITRPNCRHYFKAITIEDALTKDAKTLVRNHKMHRAVGNEDMKPIYHSTNKTWYTRSNIENIIKKYQERLDYHNALYSVHPTQTLKRMMEKDRLLINKWRKLLWGGGK